jgi:hypothetical protein
MYPRLVAKPHFEEQPTMSTERQIESNRRNSKLSTGPKSPEGKAKSRVNALKHGLAADTLVIDSLQADFAERKALWAADIKPDSPEACFALEAVVACTFRIEECRRSINARIDNDTTRACLVWDSDRDASVAVVASKLPKQPEVVSRRLQSSKHGIELMLRTWNLLGESLDAKKGAWSDAELSTALDLLGIPSHLRDGRTPFDPFTPGDDVYQCRRAFIFQEYARLQSQQAGFSRVDKSDREHAETGASVLGTKPVTLLLRYENAAWRRYDTMLKVAKGQAIVEATMPEVIETPENLEADAAFNEEVRAMIATDSSVDMEAMMEDDPSDLDEEDAVPNEAKRASSPSRPLNRHQRRRMASKARKA